MEFLISEQIFDLHIKIESNELVEHDMEYHKEIAEAFKNDYYLAFDCFASCSVEFYMWFSKDFLFEIIEILRFHGKKELLIILKAHLLELVDENPYDSRISSIGTIYHYIHKSLN